MPPLATADALEVTAISRLQADSLGLINWHAMAVGQPGRPYAGNKDVGCEGTGDQLHAIARLSPLAHRAEMVLYGASGYTQAPSCLISCKASRDQA